MAVFRLLFYTLYREEQLDLAGRRPQVKIDVVVSQF
jgi:hypothetical protein